MLGPIAKQVAERKASFVRLVPSSPGALVPPTPGAVEHERHQDDREHAREHDPEGQGDSAVDAKAAVLETAHGPDDQQDQGDEAQARC